MNANEKLIEEVLKTYCFKEVCEIEVDNKIPTFSYEGYEEHNALCKERGGVYLWVVKKNDKPCEVIYVGKVDKSNLEGRNKMHERGFNDKGKGGSKSGGKLKEGLCDKINKSKVVLYFRQSPSKTIMSEKKISICHIEEAALIQKFNNYDNYLLNEEGFRRRKKEEKKQ